MADAYNQTLPLDTDKARFAAEELRAIKARMDAITGSNLSGIFSGRNRAINPFFMVDQQTPGSAYSANNSWSIDGWYRRGGGALSATIQTTRQNVLPNGLVKSQYHMRHLASVVHTPLAAADYYSQIQPVEFNMVQDFFVGANSISAFTVSFKVSANTPGTYCFFIQDRTRSYSFVKTFVVTAANVFQQIVINVPANGGLGTWFGAANDTCFFMGFNLGAGANRTTATNGAWVAGEYQNVSGSIQPCESGSNFFSITDFQLELGTVVNPVTEAIPLDSQIRYCQRYLEKSFNIDSAISVIGGVSGALQFASMVGASASIAAVPVRFQTIKRGTSSTTISVIMWNPAAANAQVRNITDGADCSATTVEAASIGNMGFSFSLTTSAGTAAGEKLAVHWSAYSLLTV